MLVCLIQSFSLGKEKIVKLLIENDANLNLVDNDGNCPIHYAVAQGNF